MGERCATSARLSAHLQRVKAIFVQILCISGQPVVIVKTSVGGIHTIQCGQSWAIIVKIRIGWWMLLDVDINVFVRIIVALVIWEGISGIWKFNWNSLAREKITENNCRRKSRSSKCEIQLFGPIKRTRRTKTIAFATRDANYYYTHSVHFIWFFLPIRCMNKTNALMHRLPTWAQQE